MRIEVTSEDIKLGKITKSSQTVCPIGRAIRRKIKNAYVTVESAFPNERLNWEERVELPRKVESFILNMLEGKKRLRPFSFELTSEQVKKLRVS